VSSNSCNFPKQLLILSPSVILFTHPETAVVPCGCLYPQTAVSSNSCWTCPGNCWFFPFSYSVYSPWDSCSHLWLSVSSNSCNFPRQLLILSPSVIVFTHPETAVVPCGCLYPQTAAELTQTAAHCFPSVIVFTHPETAVVPCGCLYPQTAAELTQAAAHSFPSVIVFTHPETAVVPCGCLYITVLHAGVGQFEAARQGEVLWELHGTRVLPRVDQVVLRRRF